MCKGKSSQILLPGQDLETSAFLIVLFTESRCSKSAGSICTPTLGEAVIQEMACCAKLQDRTSAKTRQWFRKLVKVCLWGRACCLPKVLFSTPQVACTGCGAAGLRNLREASACFNQQGCSLNRVRLSRSGTGHKAEVLCAQERWLGSLGRNTAEHRQVFNSALGNHYPGDGCLPGTEEGCRLNLTRLKEDEVISHCCSPDGVPSETRMAA